MAANRGLEAGRELNVLEQTIAYNANDGSLTPCASANQVTSIASGLHGLFLNIGVEENGVRPVPPEERTDTRHSNIFTVFFTCLLSVLPLPTGALGTTLLYLVAIPTLLNAGTVTGFTLVGSIVSGQAIASVNEKANISVNVGIGIVCTFSFFMAFLGYRAVHLWQRWQWVPNLIAITIAVGCGGKHLMNQTEHDPATVKSVVGYGGLMAGYFMTFGGTVSDFTVYHSNEASKMKVFAYVYLGFLIPSTPLLILGAAIGGALPNVEPWQNAWDSYGIGGVMAEMLEPAGGFGKFVLVVLALSAVGNMVLSNYSVALCLQMLVPTFTKVPRFLFILVTLAIMIPMSIYAAAQWEESLVNFLSIIGYWAGCFDAVLIEELVVFRGMNYSSFDPRIWDRGRSLPTGMAAIGASLVSLSVVIPSMDTPWFIGPIGRSVGDLGFESAFIVTGIAYYPLRSLEIKLMGHI
ncbi:purine-cytosine permease fcy22 [Fusarium avenaceum]|nr:purine-cytosine permease fcy22 [Fusarium avenaceum]